MKPLLTLLLFIPLSSFCQDSKYVFKLKEHIAPATGMFVAGMADGFRDACLFHNDRVLARIKGGERFFGPESWRNKYKNGDPLQGERFWGSSRWFAFTTDAPHLLKFIDNFFTVGAISFKLVKGERRKWYIYIAEAAAYWLCNRLGFVLSYNVIFK